MPNVVVKLFTRPVVKGKRKWAEVNPKLDYPDGTVFILRWLPHGAKNYSTKDAGGPWIEMGAGHMRLVRAA